MTRLHDALGGAADGEVEPQTVGEVSMSTPPSCSVGTANPSTARFTATVRFGDNKPTGLWEYSLASSLGASLGQYSWGGTTGVPFNSGQVPLDITVELAGTQSLATLSVGTGLPLAMTGAPYTTIDRVGIRVEVTRQFSNQSIHLRAEWSSLDVTFFDNQDNGYTYPGLATQRCPLPFYAETPPPPSFGTTHQTRIVMPGSVSNAVYPVRMTLNGMMRFTSDGGPDLLSANQLVTKVYIWAS